MDRSFCLAAVDVGVMDCKRLARERETEGEKKPSDIR